MTRQRLDRRITQLQTARSVASQQAATVATLADDYAASLQARKLCQEVAEAVQASAHAQISGLVRRCLAAVFGAGAFGFDIRFEQKRGKTEARLVFVEDGNEIDPTEAGSGGAMDVAAFALRLACLMLSAPKARRLLVIDEPFKMVANEHLPAVRDLLEALAEETGTQIIMVAHPEALRCGTVVSL